MAKNYTVIEDLVKKVDIEDDNLIIVEDADDTKKSTIKDLKKALSGDYKDPSDLLFYSSSKIEDALSDVRRGSSTYASKEEVKKINDRISSIIASAGTGKDTEIVDARDGSETLSKRLKRDIEFADNRFMKKVNKVISGTQVSTGGDGYVDISVNKMSGSTADLIFKSKNLFNISYNKNTSQVEYNDLGLKYTQSDSNDMTVSLKFEESLPRGKYYFFTSIEYGTTFTDKGAITFAIRNSKDDSAYTEFVYNQTGKFEFSASKAFDEIKLIFNKNKYVSKSTVEFYNIMVSNTNKDFEYYMPYANFTKTIEKYGSLLSFYNNDYDITCSDKNAIISVYYYDSNITIESINDTVDELKSTILDNRDKCGLITNYGDYLFFNDSYCETPASCRLELDDDIYMRNGTPSLKVTFNEGSEVNPLFALKMNKYVENIESVSIVFYIDRDVSYYITNNNPITIYLCSDSYNEPDMVNYLYISLNKDEIIQGWNIIKKNINEFTTAGMPNVHGIQYTKVEFDRGNGGLDNRSMYFNSIIFNQRMKPTVLLAFDGIYDEGLTYTYPYLTTRGIPATILSNNRTTFSRTVLEKVVELRAKYGWDLGQYGCNPNKELLTKDDNAREQYLALKTAKEWLQNNLVYNPISYSAPFGNLRPITVPLLKDMGYKIAKTSSSGYCNFFDPEYDFAIPMTLMSNTTTSQEIIEKIQYAIDNNCCICIYTNNVTEYGDESSSKKILLEDVIKFILENKDKISVMTFSDFYNKCKKD